MHSGKDCRSIALLLFALPATAVAQQIAIGEYSVPTSSSGPWGITMGPDGALWFTESGHNRIGRITTAGSFTTYVISTPGSYPQGITKGADGALWFADPGANQIGRITTAGTIIEYVLPASHSAPTGITAGPDGALWFTESGANQIGRITTAGVLTEYPIPTANSEPQEIAAGPDDALWFTEQTGGNIGRITTGGSVREYPVPTANPTLWGITAGPDGALWFTEPTYPTPKIGRVTTTGLFNEYALSDPESNPLGIAVGPDGALWFTDPGATTQIGRITTGGAITEYPLATQNRAPLYITTGPDGELWFTDQYSRIGEAVFVTAELGVSPVSGVYHTPLTFTGTGFAAGESVWIYLAGVGSAVLTSGTADSVGSVTAVANTPPSTLGPRIFLGLGQSSRKLGAASFSIESRLLITPNSGAVGSTATLSGAGFEPLTRIKIYWDSPRTLLGTVVTDAHGSFSGGRALTFQVPAGAAPGSHLIYTLQNGQPSFTVHFTVQ